MRTPRSSPPTRQRHLPSATAPASARAGFSSRSCSLLGRGLDAQEANPSYPREPLDPVTDPLPHDYDDGPVRVAERTRRRLGPVREDGDCRDVEEEARVVLA